MYTNSESPFVFAKMAVALQATGRPIVYSLSNGGFDHIPSWASTVGSNLWRTTPDIQDWWSSMISNIEAQVAFAPAAGPGHWNDPDMLEIGNGGMTDDEYHAQMTLWALSAAPLLAGNDLRGKSATTLSILLNSEVIAVDQDALGAQASRVPNGSLETWFKPLADGSVAVGLLNPAPVRQQEH